jgi:hypothetical protein
MIVEIGKEIQEKTIKKRKKNVKIIQKIIKTQKIKNNLNKKLISLKRNNSSQDKIEDQEGKEIKKETEILEDRIVQGTMTKDKAMEGEERKEEITIAPKEGIMRIDIDKVILEEHKKDDRIGDRIGDRIRDKIRDRIRDRIEEITEEIKEEVLAEMIEKDLTMVKKIIATDKKENMIRRMIRIMLAITKEENNAAEEQDEVLPNIITTKVILKLARMIIK